MKQIPIIASKKETVKPKIGGVSRVRFALGLEKAGQQTSLTSM